MVESSKALVAARQAAQAKTQLAFNLAFKQEAATQATLQKVQAQYDRAVEVNHRAEANLGTAKNVVAIAETALANAQANFKAAVKFLAEAQ